MARPRKIFTDEDMARMDDMASVNCKDYTIAEVLGISPVTLKRRFGKRLIKKRSEFKARLRGYQNKLAESTPAMAIFLGKNELNQTDKQIIEHEDGQPQFTEAEKARYRLIARNLLRKEA